MPNNVIQYLTFDEVMEIHAVVIEQFGGPSGIRDPGLLESALYRLRTGYYNDLFESAAALFESLIINHPFVDGNKRVAFFSTDVFLRLNGYKFTVDADVTNALLLDLLAKGECDYQHLLQWIKESVITL